MARSIKDDVYLEQHALIFNDLESGLEVMRKEMAEMDISKAWMSFEKYAVKLILAGEFIGDKDIIKKEQDDATRDTKNTQIINNNSISLNYFNCAKKCTRVFPRLYLRIEFGCQYRRAARDNGMDFKDNLFNKLLLELLSYQEPVGSLFMHYFFATKIFAETEKRYTRIMSSVLLRMLSIYAKLISITNGHESRDILVRIFSYPIAYLKEDGLVCVIRSGDSDTIIKDIAWATFLASYQQKNFHACSIIDIYRLLGYLSEYVKLPGLISIITIISQLSNCSHTQSCNDQQYDIIELSDCISELIRLSVIIMSHSVELLLMCFPYLYLIAINTLRACNSEMQSTLNTMKPLVEYQFKLIVQCDKLFTTAVKSSIIDGVKLLMQIKHGCVSRLELFRLVRLLPYNDRVHLFTYYINLDRSTNECEYEFIWIEEALSLFYSMYPNEEYLPGWHAKEETHIKMIFQNLKGDCVNCYDELLMNFLTSLNFNRGRAHRFIRYWTLNNNTPTFNANIIDLSEKILLQDYKPTSLLILTCYLIHATINEDDPIILGRLLGILNSSIDQLIVLDICLDYLVDCIESLVGIIWYPQVRYKLTIVFPRLILHNVGKYKESPLYQYKLAVRIMSYCYECFDDDFSDPYYALLTRVPQTLIQSVISEYRKTNKKSMLVNDMIQHFISLLDKLVHSRIHPTLDISELIHLSSR